MDKLIIELPQWQFESIKTMTHKSNPVDIGVMINAMTSIANGVVIPDNATNGDVIRALFPNNHIDEMSHTVWIGYDDMAFRKCWWNSPYKGGDEDYNAPLCEDVIHGDFMARMDKENKND